MKSIQTDKAPSAIGPYSQAVVANGFVFCSGQISLRPDATLVEGSVQDQAVQVLENLSAILLEAGSSLEKVVKTTIYLTDMADFAVVNDVYAKYFSGELMPARATVQVAALPKAVKVEIDCIAVL